MAENAWRVDNCPNYGDAFCLCPFDAVTCDGAWACGTLEDVTIEVVAYYNSGLADMIDIESDIDAKHYSILVDLCDFNNDGNVDSCEAFSCVL